MAVHRTASNDIDIICDECGEVAPPAAEIMAGHGLNRMGWDCHGGTHLCPRHNPNNKEQQAC